MKLHNWFRGPIIAIVLLATCIQTALAQVDSAACSSLTDSLLLGAGSLPDMAADPLGYIHVVWADPTQGVMYEQVGLNGTITVPPTSVYPGAGYSIPHIAVDKYGNAHVVAGLNIGQILYLKISGGQRVGINVFLINTDGNPDQADYSPCIAINPTTQLPVVAAEVHTDYYAYYYGLYVYSTYIASVFLDAGGNPVPGSVFDAWYDMETPNNLFNAVSYPSVAVDNAGVTHVVWEYQDPSLSGLTVGYANSASSSWEEIASTANISGFAGRPVIIRGGDGNLDVVWSNSGHAVVWTQISPKGLIMVNNSIVSQTAAIPSWPNLASASGQLVCSWTDGRNGANSQIFARSLLNAVPECDVSESPGAASFGVVTINSSTNPAYVWQDSRSGSTQLYYRTASSSVSVSGQITSTCDDSPIAGALVQIGSYSGTSASDGSYSISGIPSGTYTASVSANNYSSVTSSLTISSTKNATQNFSLNPLPDTISVTASPTDGGTVSPGGTYASCTPRTVTATANSGYTFANWTQNGNVVSMSTSYTFTLTGDIALVANFVALANVTGQITCVCDGSSISGATVTIGGFSAQTDNDGNYSIAGFLQGTEYPVAIVANGYLALNNSVSIAPGVTQQPANFALTPSVQPADILSGSVTFGGNVPLDPKTTIATFTPNPNNGGMSLECAAYILGVKSFNWVQTWNPPAYWSVALILANNYFVTTGPVTPPCLDPCPSTDYLYVVKSTTALLPEVFPCNPPSDGSGYYYNLSEVTQYIKQFKDTPAFPEEFFKQGDFVLFTTRLVGVKADGNPKYFGYHTGFSWHCNSGFDGSGGVGGYVSLKEENPTNVPPLISGDIFDFNYIPELQVIANTNQTIVISWLSLAGFSFEAQYCTNLLATNWSTFSTVTATTNSILSVTDAPSADLPRFYRVVQQ